MAGQERASRREKPVLPGWAHRCGEIALGGGASSADPAPSQRAIERVTRYCWAYDERRADILADCFSEDAVWVGTVLGEIAIGPYQSRQAIVDWLTQFWPHQHDQRRHMVLNHLVERISPNEAETLSYLLLTSSDGASVKIECTGFYRCELRMAGDDWQITSMSAGFDAPFWPGALEELSEHGRKRHGILDD